MSVDTSPTSYLNLSVGRAYIGGSLIYNETTGGTNQLKPGMLIAVREGVVTSKYESEEVYEYDGTETGKEINTANVNPTTKQMMVYEDNPDLAVYGWIEISSVSLDSVSFKYTKYGRGGFGRSSKSYTIKSGEGVDVDANGTVDIKYREPNQIRTGFQKSRWLEFVCDNDVLKKEIASSSTMMFSVIKDDIASRTLVRAADGASVQSSDYGLYGVNSNGSFIYLLKSNGSVNSTGGSLTSAFSDYNLQYGDYVITVDEDTASNAESLNSDNTKNSTQSYVVSYKDADSTNSSLTLNNSSIAAQYLYSAKQFQSDKGPNDLLCRMPQAIFENLSSAEEQINLESVKALDTDQSVALLNRILSLGTTTANILLDPANGIVTSSDALTQSEKEYLYELCDSSEKAIKAVRRIIDSLFVQSPQADLLSPSIESMYPYLSVNLGDSISQDVATVPLEYEANANSRALGMASNFDDYEKQKKAIKSKFDQYFAIELKSIDLGKKKDKDGNVEKDENGKEKTKTATLKDYGVKFAIGVKGSISNTSGQVKAGVGGVIYLDIGLSLLEKGFDEIKKPLEDALKTELKKTVMVGAVPVTVGVKLGFGLDLKITRQAAGEKPKTIDLVFGYIGMYGADVSVGANYGVNWKGKWCFKVPVPYINFFGNVDKVSETAWYFGAASGSLIDDIKSMTETPWNFILTPSITIEPLVGIGPSWANFNVSLPVKPMLPLQFYYAPLLPLFPPLLHEIDLGLEIKAKAGLDIKVLVFKVSHTFFEEKLIDWTGDNAYVVWKLKDDPFAQ